MMTDQETREWVAVVQVNAAEEAHDIGEFQDVFKTEVMHVIAEGGNESIVHERIDVIADATKDQTHIALASTDAGVLGYNYIGAGDEGARLSKQMFGTITTADDAVQAQITAEHEARHGQQKQLTGDVVFNNDVVVAHSMFEGDSETYSVIEVGMHANQHRQNQPEDYRADQNVVYAMQQVVGQELWNRVLTETGDVSELQAALDEKDMGQTSTQA